MRSVLAGLVLALGLAAGSAATAAETNLLANPGFESTTDWTFYGFGYSGEARTGERSMATGCVGGNALSYCKFGQTVATSAGGKYDLSFWVRNNYAYAGTDAQQFEVTWNGASLGVVNFDKTEWTQVTYTGLAATAASTLLQVAGRNDPAGIFFDDFSLTGAGGAVPEPATWALLIGGMGLTGGALRRRRGLSVATA